MGCNVTKSADVDCGSGSPVAVIPDEGFASSGLLEKQTSDHRIASDVTIEKMEATLQNDMKKEEKSSTPDQVDENHGIMVDMNVIQDVHEKLEVAGETETPQTLQRREIVQVDSSDDPDLELEAKQAEAKDEDANENKNFSLLYHEILPLLQQFVMLAGESLDNDINKLSAWLIHGAVRRGKAKRSVKSAPECDELLSFTAIFHANQVDIATNWLFSQNQNQDNPDTTTSRISTDALSATQTESSASNAFHDEALVTSHRRSKSSFTRKKKRKPNTFSDSLLFTTFTRSQNESVISDLEVDDASIHSLHNSPSLRRLSTAPVLEEVALDEEPTGLLNSFLQRREIDTNDTLYTFRDDDATCDDIHSEGNQPVMNTEQLNLFFRQHSSPRR